MSDTQTPLRVFDRELSWLQFNARVLQEAEDARTPLFDRLFFLAVWSSNLDEFFRVRVASLRTRLRLGASAGRGHEGDDPARVLRAIYARVTEQQDRFGRILRGALLPALEAEGIALLSERHLSERQRAFVEAYVAEHVRSQLSPVVLPLHPVGGDGAEPTGPAAAPFLLNNRLYLVVELWPRKDEGRSRPGGQSGPSYGLVDVPSPPLNRFVVLPTDPAADSALARAPHPVLFLDDAVRTVLPDLFPGFEAGAAYAIKLSRDAELIYRDSHDAFDEDEAVFRQQVEEALAQRDRGIPSRFLYDAQAPFGLLAALKTCFGLEDEDLVPGGRTHNLSDFADFPRFGRDDLRFPPQSPLAHPTLSAAPSILAAVRERDHLIHPPYQSFQPVVRFVEEAAADPDVTDLWITLYRAADDSAMVQALLRAAEQGKRVHACIEIMARFDEAPNLKWAAALEAAGATVRYSYPGLKVHAKLMLAARREQGATRHYAYLGTGNLNEKTARVYADHGLLTADPRLTDDVRKVFGFLMHERGYASPTYDHVLVAPTTLRSGFEALIADEIAEARAGRRGHMVLKMNALEDAAMVERLYEASQAGVDVELICRGLCVARPGVPGLSEHVQARSIVGRYLEHARVYDFFHGGERRLYLSSADWMHRNLSRRVEVAFPILDADCQAELRTLLEFQRQDTEKARVLDAAQRNRFVPKGDQAPVDAQRETYRWLKAKLD
ncbi:MAG: polyphosphate kinase 1 [Bacteroidota bacterium]